MSDNEISRALALAIGFDLADVDLINGGIHVKRFIYYEKLRGGDGRWMRFDYRDPSVIWPIASRYQKFPPNGVDEPERFVAYAVIDAKQRGEI